MGDKEIGANGGKMCWLFGVPERNLSITPISSPLVCPGGQFLKPIFCFLSLLSSGGVGLKRKIRQFLWCYLRSSGCRDSKHWRQAEPDSLDWGKARNLSVGSLLIWHIILPEQKRTQKPNSKLQYEESLYCKDHLKQKWLAISIFPQYWICKSLFYCGLQFSYTRVFCLRFQMGLGR